MGTLYETRELRLDLFRERMSVEDFKRESHHIRIFGLFRDGEELGEFCFLELLFTETVEQGDQGMKTHTGMVIRTDQIEEPFARLWSTEVSKKSNRGDDGGSLGAFV